MASQQHQQQQKQQDEDEKHVRIALVTPGSRQQSDASDQQRIRWDEDTIAEHDKLRGTRQKINEPDTPYNFDSQSDMSDTEGSVHSVVHSPGVDRGKAQATLEGVIKAVKVRLPTADQLDKERTARWEGEQPPSSEQDRFKQKRAQHYNEMHMVREWRQRHSMDEDDPTEEENGGGGGSGSHMNGNSHCNGGGGGGHCHVDDVCPRA